MFSRGNSARRQPQLVPRERFVPAVGDQVVALEPHPPDSWQIKSRFECDHVVGLERLDALRNQVGRFEMPQAQPMPGVRGEVAVEPVCSEMAANRGVYLRCRHVRAQERLAGRERSHADLVQLDLPRRGFIADHESVREIVSWLFTRSA